VTQCFKQGFDIKKYGFLGKTDNDGEKDLIKEVIREKRVEVPVEIIVEKEVIKEVPVEVKVIEYVDREVIKEVLVDVPKETIVTKIEYISDKTNENELALKIQKLEETILHLKGEMESERQEFSAKTEEMSKIFQDKMSNKDENTDNSKQKMLESTLQNLRKELTQKNQTIEELIQKNKLLESQLNNKNAVYLKGSNLNERI
jgi:hypothetical protein